jgi:hypothetical protein
MAKKQVAFLPLTILALMGTQALRKHLSPTAERDIRRSIFRQRRCCVVRVTDHANDGAVLGGLGDQMQAVGIAAQPIRRHATRHHENLPISTPVNARTIQTSLFAVRRMP